MAHRVSRGDLFRLSAELSPWPYGGAPSAPLYDSGSGRVPLTRSSTTTVRRYRSRSAKEIAGDGIGTLYIGGSSDYLRASYRASNAAWKGYGNAVSAGDFFIGGFVEVPSGASGAEARFVAVVDASVTAAGTAWAFGVTSANTLFFEYSDGTTVSRLTSSAAGDMAANGRYYVAAVRYKGNLYLHRATLTATSNTARRKLTTIVGHASSLGSLNVPSGAVISFGANAAGSTFSGGFMLDGWRIRANAPGFGPFPVPEFDGQMDTPPAIVSAQTVSSAALDSLTTNLWCACSVWRKLISSYSGAAIRVRRSSDNTEQDFGFVGKALDLASLLVFCGSGSGYVKTVYDQSGGSNDWAQSTSGAQPRIVNAGVFVGYLEFDGSDDVLTSAATPGGNTGFSVSTRFTLVPGGSGSMVVEHGNSSLGQDRFFWQNDPNSPVSGQRIFLSPSPFGDQQTNTGTTTLKARGVRYDKTKTVSSAACTAWESTGQLSTSDGPNSGSPSGSGTFNNYTIHMGGRDAVAGSQFGPLKMYDFAVWSAAISDANMTAACVALDGP